MFSGGIWGFSPPNPLHYAELHISDTMFGLCLETGVELIALNF